MKKVELINETFLPPEERENKQDYSWVFWIALLILVSLIYNKLNNGDKGNGD